MTSAIDSQILELKFDNKQFEDGIRQSLNTLKTLNENLKLQGATKGLNDVQAAAGRMNLGHIAQGVDTIASKFNAMSVIAITALSNITNKAINAGTQLAKSLTIDPIKAGFDEYELKLGSVQTILANTQAAGTSLKDVNGTLKELNTYSDQTIYNFGEMARNIGTFTAAGVDLKTATGSIKGIANLAALSGSNSQQASTAMYQLSQAISAGRVSLQDWNSVVNAGMGGSVFQRALAQTAEAMGTLDKGAVKLTGKMKNATINGKSFRESITAKPGEKSWLTSEVLTSTLKQFTGDLKESELAAMGFSKSQIQAIQQQAATAKSAATEVKTATQLMGTLKEAAGSGWAESWELIVGDFEEAKKLWTGVNNVFGGIIQSSADARNKVIKDWKDAGGRTALIAGFKNAFRALVNLVKPVQEAFRQIFPKTSGKQLAELTKKFEEFTKKLMPGYETIDRLKRTFAGIFAVFGIGWEIVKQVARVFGELFASASGGSGSFLKITASIGDFLVKLHDAIKNGEGLTTFFDGLAAVIKVPITMIKKLLGFLGDLFEGLDFSALDGIGDKFKGLTDVGNSVGSIWSRIGDFMKAAAKGFAPLASKFLDFFTGLGDKITSFFGSANFDAIISLINTGLLAGIVVIFKQFTSNLGEGVDIIGGWKEKLTSPFSAMTDTLGEMQKTLKAATLLQIAAAVALLAFSVVELSRVDAEGLYRALGAMTVLFTQLTVAMAIFQKIDIKSGMGQLILMAVALRILTSSVVALAQLSWEELIRGLTATGLLMLGIAAAARLMPDGKKMISSSVGLILMATAVKILVSAVSDLAKLSWEDLQKGLVGVGAVLASLALFTRLSSADKTGLASGAGLLLMAVGVKLLAEAVSQFADMSWEEIGRGLTAMAGAVGMIALALKLIPPSSLLSAAAVLIVAASLGMLADALGQMGKMGWEEIGKGLTVLGGSLLIIGLAMAGMTGALPGAAALLVVAYALQTLMPVIDQMGKMEWEQIGKAMVVLAGSLAIIALAMAGMTAALPGAAALAIVAGSLALLAPIMLAFGQMDWMSILKGLTMLAGIFLVLGVAGAVLTPVIPSLLGLGVAITLIGVGVMAAGVGLLAFSVGIAALAGSAGLIVVVLTAVVSAVIGLIPMIMKGLEMALIAFAGVIGRAAPALVDALVALLSALLDGIVKLLPKVEKLIIKLVDLILNVLTDAIPKVVKAGMKIIIGILDGIAKNIKKVIEKGTDIVVAFIEGIGDAVPRVVDAAAKMIIKFINGLADAIRDNQKDMNEAGKNLGSAIIEGMVSGVNTGVELVVNAAKSVGGLALKAIKKILGINSPSREFMKVGKWTTEGFAIGLMKGKEDIKAAVKAMTGNLSNAMRNSLEDIKQLESRLKRLKSARKQDTKAIKETAEALATARSEYKKFSAAYKASKTFGDESKALGKLADQADKVATKLADARQKLDDATKVRDDFKNQIVDQYDNLPDITKDTRLTDFIADFEKKVVDTQIFAAQLAKLREMGLNDAMYKELLAKGPDAIPFLEQVLDGGQTAVDQLNTIGSAMDKAAKDLGNSASTALYQAGVDAAAGLVKGLEQQQDAIKKQMEKIADAMVAAIKKKLGIKSPSREFMKIGVWSNEGLARGFSESKAAILAAEDVGHNAIDAMRKTLTEMVDILPSELDMSPTIRPVLDLSRVQKDANGISRVVGSNSIRVGASYSSVREATRGYRANRFTEDDAMQSAGSNTSVVFNQNNFSPKTLPTRDIYRNTNSGISKLKEELAKR